MTDQCNGCSLGHMVTRIQHLEAENLHLRMYAPARRATTNTEPVKAIGPCNFSYWFGRPIEYFEVQPGRIMSDAESDFYVSKLTQLPPING